MDDYVDRIAPLIPEVARFEGVCGGRPVFSQSRLPLATIIGCLSDTDEDILSGYPRLTPALLSAIRFTVKQNPPPWSK